MHAGNSLPRWRTALIALVLVLATGSAGQAPPVQAAPAGVLAYFSMEVQNPKTTLRCGETVTYLVSVDVAPSNGLPTPSPRSLGLPRGISIVGVNVEADSTNKSVGDFVGAGTVRTAVVFDSELTTGLAAKFKFKAGKPGKTTLYFDGLVGTEHVAVQLEVKVLPCKFKVNTVTTWRAGMTSMGIMDAEMESDENGSFTGTATINWVTSTLCGGGIVSPIAPGSADLTGTISESGQLVGEITFGPMTSVGGGSCHAATSNFGTLDPLTIKASSEGVSVYTQSQAVAATNGSFGGTATIVVIPEEVEAVSSIPGHHQADWGVFLSLFGALLDLH